MKINCNFNVCLQNGIGTEKENISNQENSTRVKNTLNNK